MKSILEDATECYELLQDAQDDPESKEMLEEEVKELQTAVVEISDTLLENILEPEEFDDCNSATMEFRPGKFLNIFS